MLVTPFACDVGGSFCGSRIFCDPLMSRLGERLLGGGRAVGRFEDGGLDCRDSIVATRLLVTRKTNRGLKPTAKVASSLRDEPRTIRLSPR